MCRTLEAVRLQELDRRPCRPLDRRTVGNNFRSRQDRELAVAMRRLQFAQERRIERESQPTIAHNRGRRRVRQGSRLA